MNRPFFALGLALLGACTRTPDTSNVSPPASATPPASAPSPSARAALPAVPEGSTSCGALSCLQFSSPESAFRYVIASRPLVLAVGEAHAQKGKESVDSCAKRFSSTFLPFLQGKASDLVLELMMPNATCKKKTERVREKQKPVTSQQAAGNQNEYVAMGDRARGLAIVPDLLRPSCVDLDAIDKAGDDAIPTFLETIARLTRTQAGKLIERNANTPADSGKMVVTYGGVLHNDRQPSADRAAWSFGPQLSQRAGGRYVELDLFVPEFIEDNDTWRKLPWFAHYDRDKLGDQTTLYELQPGTFALIFPRSGDPTP